MKYIVEKTTELSKKKGGKMFIFGIVAAMTGILVNIIVLHEIMAILISFVISLLIVAASMELNYKDRFDLGLALAFFGLVMGIMSRFAPIILWILNYLNYLFWLALHN